MSHSNALDWWDVVQQNELNSYEDICNFITWSKSSDFTVKQIIFDDSKIQIKIENDNLDRMVL